MAFAADSITNVFDLSNLPIGMGYLFSNNGTPEYKDIELSDLQSIIVGEPDNSVLYLSSGALSFQNSIQLDNITVNNGIEFPMITQQCNVSGDFILNPFNTEVRLERIGTCISLAIDSFEIFTPNQNINGLFTIRFTNPPVEYIPIGKNTAIGIYELGNMNFLAAENIVIEYDGTDIVFHFFSFVTWPNFEVGQNHTFYNIKGQYAI